MEWKTVRLGDYISIKSGLAYKGSKLGHGDSILLGMGCVSFKDKFVMTGARPYNDVVDDRFCVAPGDIVLATRQQSDNLPILAMPAIIPPSFEGKRVIFGTNLYKVDNHSEISNRFLFWLLKHQHYVNYIAGVKSGTAVQMVTKKNVEDYKFLCPPKKEREKIADILWTYDSLIENNKKRIKLLEQMAENLYKEWFVRFRFPGHETAEFEGGVPKGWKRVSLREYANVIMGQSPESCFYNTEKLGLPFHQGCGSYGEFYLRDDIYSTEGKRIAEPNSIIFSVRAPVGRINLTLNKIILGRGVAGINAKNNNNAFLLWLLKQKFSKEDIIGNGAIFTSVTKNELLGQKLLIPNKELERKFNVIASNIETEIKLLTLQKEVLTTQRDLLLPRLMSGKLSI